MPRLKVALYAAAVMLACGGMAFAQTPEWHTKTIKLPDGTTTEIRYLGDVEPQVTFATPAPRRARTAMTEDPVDAASGIPRARRVIQAPSSTPAPQVAAPSQFAFPSDAPSGSTYHHTLITFGADGRVCAQRTDWTSRGRKKEPEVTRTDTGDGCFAASSPPVAMGAVPTVAPAASVDPATGAVPPSSLIEPAPTAAPASAEAAPVATAPAEETAQPMPPTPTLKRIKSVDPDGI